MYFKALNLLKVRKFSVFFEFSIRTSAYLGIAVYWDLADSAQVHQAHCPRHKTSVSHSIFPLSADALEEKSDLQVFLILRLPVPKRDLEKNNSVTTGYGLKISNSFFRLGMARIVFSSFCKSRKVVWNQSELKNRATNGLASFH